MTEFQRYISELESLIFNRFSVNELKSLCSDLYGHSDLFEGFSKDKMARQIVAYAIKCSAIDKLVDYIQLVRSDIPLGSIPNETIEDYLFVGQSLSTQEIFNLFANGAYKDAQKILESITLDQARSTMYWLLLAVSLLANRSPNSIKDQHIIRKIESYLRLASQDVELCPVAFIMLYIIKVEYYEINGLADDPPYIDEIRRYLNTCQLTDETRSILKYVAASDDTKKEIEHLRW